MLMKHIQCCKLVIMCVKNTYCNWKGLLNVFSILSNYTPPKKVFIFKYFREILLKQI